MRKRVRWLRADVQKLKELINEKSNKELEDIFECDLSELTSIMKRHRIKRDPEFVKKLMVRTGSAAPRWKGGCKPDAYKHRKTQLAKWPERDKARRAVGYQVKTGQMIKPTCCSQCGKEESYRNIHFHHTKSYEVSDQLIGIWLCRTCHTNLHEQYSTEELFEMYDQLYPSKEETNE